MKDLIDTSDDAIERVINDVWDVSSPVARKLEALLRALMVERAGYSRVKPLVWVEGDASVIAKSPTNIYRIQGGWLNGKVCVSTPGLEYHWADTFDAAKKWAQDIENERVLASIHQSDAWHLLVAETLVEAEQCLEQVKLCPDYTWRFKKGGYSNAAAIIAAQDAIKDLAREKEKKNNG